MLDRPLGSAASAVRDLVSAYCRLWDDRQYDQWIELFTVDAAFDWRGHLAHGRDGIQALIGSGNRARPDGPGLHVMTNTLVQVEGDRATASSDFLFVAPRDGRPEIHYAGRTYDHCARGSTGWQFTLRVVRFLGEDPPEGWNTTGIVG
jgi:3-phenylpropionate/cinnamic acid dioxygenase small subunit